MNNKNIIKPTPKTQKEISNQLRIPYIENSITSNNINRGKEISTKGDSVKPFQLGLYEIDAAIIYYIENILKLEVENNGRIVKVPLIYLGSEKTKQVQKDGYYRDNKNKINPPFITFNKISLSKDRNLGNKMDGNNPHNFGVFNKNYNKNNTYYNSLKFNNNPKREKYLVVIPNYINLNYKFNIFTYYNKQMNNLIEAIDYTSDSYWGEKESFKFYTYINEYLFNDQITLDKVDLKKCEFNLNLRGYIIPNNIHKSINDMFKIFDPNRMIFNVENETL